MKLYALLITFFLMPGLCAADNAVSADDIAKQLSVPRYRSLPGANGGFKTAPDVGRIDLPAIQFEYNSSVLTREARQQVDILGAAMQQIPREKLAIVGHTDASGSDQYNMSLSERRARSVSQYLVSELGIDPSRLEPFGKGETNLKNQNNPNSAENRRVEVVNTRVLEN